MATPEEATAERKKKAVEESLAYLKQFSKNYTNGLVASPKATITEKQASNETANLAVRPADYMSPYYGGEANLAREAQRAAIYRNIQERAEKTEYFKVPPENRIFDTVDLSISPNQIASYSYNAEDLSSPKVGAYGKRGGEITVDNSKILDEWISNDKPEERKMAEEVIFDNEYVSAAEYGGGPDPTKKAVSTLEHEIGHHVYRPQDGTKNTPAKESYFNKESELYQGLGRLQREVYQKTGSRLQKPEDLYNMIKSDDKLDYLSPEGKRVINYLRKQGDSEQADKFIKEVSRMAPMFVKADEDFVSAVNNRLS